jgi:NADPH-dependent curcumin reductase CurA
MEQSSNRAWVIQKPSVGRYTPDVLTLEERALPLPEESELRVRTLHLSLDPSNLMWLKLSPGWMEEVRVGDIMKGPSVAVVESSRHPQFKCGDIVTGPLEWRLRSNVPAAQATRVELFPGVPLTDHLAVFSHVGRAAWIGMSMIGKVRAGDVVLVSGAAGATGSLACQIAKKAGARVIGIAGGKDKCAYLTDDLDIDAAIDYRTQDVGSALQRLCPDGIDVVFENVGGALLDAALGYLRVHARVVICGLISAYSDATPADQYRFASLFQLLAKRARIEGFVVPDFIEQYAQIDAALAGLVASGALKTRAHVLDGLEHAAAGLAMLLAGSNHGKLMVAVSTLD